MDAAGAIAALDALDYRITSSDAEPPPGASWYGVDSIVELSREEAAVLAREIGVTALGELDATLRRRIESLVAARLYESFAGGADPGGPLIGRAIAHISRDAVGLPPATTHDGLVGALQRLANREAATDRDSPPRS